MKLCFPVESDEGIKSQVFNHFGSAPYFVVFDTEDKTLSSINNQDLGHSHGNCNPMKALDGKKVDVIVVGGIGAGAITRLNEMGIKVYKASSGSVEENIRNFEVSLLTEMSLQHTCGGHSGECNH